MWIVLKGCTGSFAHMSNRLWNGIWIMAIFSTALPGSSADTAVMNTCWSFPVNADIFVPPALKRGVEKSEDGSAFFVHTSIIVKHEVIPFEGLVGYAV
jgi:hypothetical protein